MGNKAIGDVSRIFIMARSLFYMLREGGKNMSSNTKRVLLFFLLISLPLMFFGSQAMGRWDARFGVPIGSHETNEWFNKQAGTNYRYDYGSYNPYYYHYYTPGYTEGNYNDDWYYDTYSHEPYQHPLTDRNIQLYNYYVGGYNDQNVNDDWYYDYYDNGEYGYENYP
jgi:hypothetical protein